MTVIAVYKDPEDIFKKLLREGHRTYLASDNFSQCDHFYNFCVTAHSLRDWCIKYLELSNAFHDEMNKIQFFPECRDIANSSKHFELRDRSSLVESVTSQDVELIVLNSAQPTLHEKISKKQIFITLNNGRDIDLFSFLLNVSQSWQTVLFDRGILKIRDNSVYLMFAEITA